MASRRLFPLLAALLVLLHALAPGVHALQLRVEEQRGEVVRTCCFAGTAVFGGGPSTPAKIDGQHRRLVGCFVGKLLLANHQYLATPPTVIRAKTPTTGSLVVGNAQIERDRRPEREPARGPPA